MSLSPPLGRGNTAMQVLRPKSDADQVFAVSGTAASSTAFDERCQVVSFLCTCAFHLAVGANPTAAAANHRRYEAGVEYYMEVNWDRDEKRVKGDKISVVQAAGESGGTMYISEMY